METDVGTGASGPGTRSVQAAATAAIRLCSAAVGLLASLAISRALQPEGRGVYAVAAAIGSLAAALGTVSLHRALQYEWGRDPDRAGLTGSSVLAGSTMGVAAAVTIGAVLAFAPGLMGPVPPLAMALALGGVPIVVVTTHLSALLILGGRPATAAAIALWSTALQTALLLAGAVAGVLTPTLVVAVGALCATLNIPLAMARLPRAPMRTKASRQRAVTLLRRGLRYHSGYVAGHLLLRVDIVIVAALRGAREAGFYSLAVAITEPITIVSSSIAQAGWAAQADGEGGDAYTARLARTALAVAAILAVVAALAAPAAVPLLFGEAFTASVFPLLVLLPGTLALAAREPFEMAVSRRDRAKLSSFVAVAALGVNVALNLALIPRWGAAGAALSATVAYAVQLALLGGWFVRAARLRVRQLAPRASDVTVPLRAALTTMRSNRSVR